jgi:hypothetical protein
VIRAVKAARQVKTSRQQQDEDAAKQEYAERGAWQLVTKDDPTMAEAYTKACAERRRLRAAGASEDEIGAGARRVIAEHFASLPEDMRDAHKCRLCRDTGWVTCFNTRAMREARQQVTQELSVDHRKWLTMLCDVSCTCASGRPTWNERRGTSIVEAPLPRFNPEQWIKLDMGVAGLLEWTLNYRPPYSDSFGPPEDTP